ncbi:MAG: hypothetical protein IT427_08395 [Pirellulales bacterium]|nr:hypothetical protein [Pirellulales bacterium]
MPHIRRTRLTDRARNLAGSSLRLSWKGSGDGFSHKMRPSAERLIVATQFSKDLHPGAIYGLIMPASLATKS